MKPYGDQIFVRPLLSVDKTSAGLIIPEEARERPSRGIVLAAGPGLANELTGAPRAMQAHEGDLVLFGQYAGMPMELDGEQVLIMRDQEALGGQPAGTYTVVSHKGPRERLVYHPASETCSDCPDRLDEEAQAKARLEEARDQLVKNGRVN